MAILTNSGRTAIAASLKVQPIHLAWGTGDAAWDVTPVPEPVTATTLVAEVGRHAATLVRYCVPDVAGSIIVPAGRFSESADPSNYLYTRFNFDFSDSPAAVIREVAIFIGSQIVAGLPSGQIYFLPADVQVPGVMLLLERFTKFTRSMSARESFEFVVQI